MTAAREAFERHHCNNCRALERGRDEARAQVERLAAQNARLRSALRDGRAELAHVEIRHRISADPDAFAVMNDALAEPNESTAALEAVRAEARREALEILADTLHAEWGEDSEGPAPLVDRIRALAMRERLATKPTGRGGR